MSRSSLRFLCPRSSSFVLHSGVSCFVLYPGFMLHSSLRFSCFIPCPGFSGFRASYFAQVSQVFVLHTLPRFSCFVLHSGFMLRSLPRFHFLWPLKKEKKKAPR